MSKRRIFLALIVIFALSESISFPADKIKPKADVRSLIEKLEVNDDLVKRQALEALGRKGKNAKIAIPAVSRCLKDKDPLVRIEAASALHKIDPSNKAPLPVLLSALRTKDTTVRCYAAVAFRGFDVTAVPPPHRIVQR